jgi:hypothetical protein
MSNANGANLIFEHGKISSIEFSVWRGNGSPDGIIARYGTFDDPDHAGAEKVNLSTVGRQNARKYFWTKTGYGIVWEQYFTKSFSDALAFNGDTERIWFVITDKSALK